MLLFCTWRTKERIPHSPNNQAFASSLWKPYSLLLVVREVWNGFFCSPREQLLFLLFHVNLPKIFPSHVIAKQLICMFTYILREEYWKPLENPFVSSCLRNPLVRKLNFYFYCSSVDQNATRLRFSYLLVLGNFWFLLALFNQIFAAASHFYNIILVYHSCLIVFLPGIGHSLFA